MFDEHNRYLTWLSGRNGIYEALGHSQKSTEQALRPILHHHYLFAEAITA